MLFSTLPRYLPEAAHGITTGSVEPCPSRASENVCLYEPGLISWLTLLHVPEAVVLVAGAAHPDQRARLSRSP